MAPTRSKKQRKSTESAMSVEMQNFPVPPQSAASKTRSPTRTPVNRSPIRKQKMGITMGQKQSLMDNLQEEGTRAFLGSNDGGSNAHDLLSSHKSRPKT